MKKRPKVYNILFLIMVLLVMLFCSDKGIKVTKYIFDTNDNNDENIKLEEQNELNNNNEEQIVVALDSGHGGFDPGKVGVNNSLEKDINLAIAKQVKAYLEENNIKVIMTREDDNGLYSEDDTNKKRTDMKNRVEIINSSNAIIAVSIHQNSFQQESSKGAQVFYHESSEAGKNLAVILQQTIKDIIKDDNTRQAKSNNTYYMLKKTKCPIVIVECGFLSNYGEAELLCTEGYQQKMGEAISKGILEYLNIINK